ncbi:MAG: chemotaxis protein CheW [Polyangiales bacterium]
MVVGARFVCAWAGGLRVAFGIEEVQEVLAPRAVTRLFHAPPAVLGVLNLRGDILPTLDLAVLVGDLEGPTPFGGSEERFLVLRATTESGAKPSSFAVRVQKLDALRDAGSGEIVPLPAGVPDRAARVSRGIVAGQGPAVLVLDAAKIAGLEEIAALR